MPESASPQVHRQITKERFRLLATMESSLEKPLAVLGFVWLGLIIASFIWGANATLLFFTYIIWALFVVDFMIRLILAPKKTRFIKRHVLDAASLLLPAFGFLRVLRFVTLVPTWSVGLLRLLAALNRGMHSLSATMRRRGLGYAIALVAFVSFAGAAGIDKFEGGVFTNYGYALWWTAMVMTTMGPDRYPQSTPGRLLMWAIAVFAFSVFGYVTAAIASYFLNNDASNPNSNVADEATIKTILSEVQALRKQLSSSS